MTKNARCLRVANWPKYQHYKDRNPPWIKLYTALLDDYEFGCLQDASKAHAICIMVLAGRMDNHLPADPAWIGKKISATETVNLDALLSTGFLELCDCASCLQAPCVQPASAPLALARSREAEAERETERETEAPPSEELAPPPSAADQAPGSAVVMLFPVQGDKSRPEWGLTEAKRAEYVESFPGLDIDGELRKARQWCRDHPAERKTARGMPAFLGRWCDKAANGRGGSPRNGNGFHPPPLGAGHARHGNPGVTQALLEEYDRPLGGEEVWIPEVPDE